MYSAHCYLSSPCLKKKKKTLFFWWNAVYERNFGPDPLIRKQQRLESAAVTLNDISISSQLPWKIMTPSCPRMSRASFQGEIYSVFIKHWQVKRHCPGRGMESGGWEWKSQEASSMLNVLCIKWLHSSWFKVLKKSQKFKQMEQTTISNKHLAFQKLVLQSL